MAIINYGKCFLAMYETIQVNNDNAQNIQSNVRHVGNLLLQAGSSISWEFSPNKNNPVSSNHPLGGYRNGYCQSQGNKYIFMSSFGQVWGEISDFSIWGYDDSIGYFVKDNLRNTYSCIVTNKMLQMLKTSQNSINPKLIGLA